MEQRQHEVTATWTCAGARLVIAARTQDLLTADIGLPDCDGQSLAGDADQHGLPHILMTGDAEAAQRIELSGQRCLSKPFNLDDFTSTVEERLKTLSGAKEA